MPLRSGSTRPIAQEINEIMCEVDALERQAEMPDRSEAGKKDGAS